MVSRRLRERRATLLVPWATSCTSAVRAQAIDRIDGRVRRRRSARDYYMYCCCCCCRRRHWQPGGREKNAHHTKTAAASNATPLSSRSDADEVVNHRISTGTSHVSLQSVVPRARPRGRACALRTSRCECALYGAVVWARGAPNGPCSARLALPKTLLKPLALCRAVPLVGGLVGWLFDSPRCAKGKGGYAARGARAPRPVCDDLHGLVRRNLAVTRNTLIIDSI